VGICREGVHEALECLYDNVAIAQVSILESFPEIASMPDIALRAQRIRSIILNAIEALQPRRPSSFRNPSTRCYQVMSLRFLEEMPMPQVAEELHVSERQAYRDLAQAEEHLAELLSSKLSAPQSALRSESLQEELDRFASEPQHLDVLSVTRAALDTVYPLAEANGVTLTMESAVEALYAYAHPILLRQTLVQTLSVTIRLCTSRAILVTVHTVGPDTVISLRFRALPSSVTLCEKEFGSARELAETQKIAFEVALCAEHWFSVSMSLPRARKLVMVVDDSASTVELYRRFLAGQSDWELMAAPSPSEAYEIARQNQPTLIVLDILLPQVDGWAVLQRLHTQPDTTTIPVVVCSVFEELALATTLGAAGYLKKPVSRADFLHALDRYSRLAQHTPA